MNILIVYATFSSGTWQASEFLQDLLKEKGHTVTLKKISETNPDEFNNYDTVFIGSPSWLVDGTEGMPHNDYLDFFKRAEGKTFENKKFAIFGLGDMAYAHFCGAVDHLKEFVAELHGILITEPLRIDGFLMDEENGKKNIQQWVDSVLNQLNQ